MDWCQVLLQWMMVLADVEEHNRSRGVGLHVDAVRSSWHLQ